MDNAKCPEDTETKLKRIAKLSERNSEQKFCSLMHHYNSESLERCFNELDKNKAVGIDKVNKDLYAKNLKENIEKLLFRMKRMSYRPGPVRQTMIPKASGGMRPLGISNFEDKIFQKMTQKILESIYDPIFKESSYGFRPRRGCHDAIKALSNYLYKNEVETVIDVDIKGYFDSIDHKLLEEFLRKKIEDPKFMRYIIRMFKSGVLTKGELKTSYEGVPQGSICSTVLANVFAHYVIDLWIEETVKPHCVGKIGYFRYADDLVICCRDKQDAVKIKRALKNRLEKYKLELNMEKTKEVPFSRRAYEKGIKQGIFDFLGFTFYIGKSRKGNSTVKLKTSGKRKRAKLKNVGKWAREIRNRYKLHIIWKKFIVKLRGHIQYYGVSHNFKNVNEFSCQSIRILFKWLNRRSQKRSFTWESWGLYMKIFPAPTVKIYHRLF
jgi:group II intron reverse transcriptase/maturase